MVGKSYEELRMILFDELDHLTTGMTDAKHALVVARFATEILRRKIAHMTEEMKGS